MDKSNKINIEYLLNEIETECPELLELCYFFAYIADEYLNELSECLPQEELQPIYIPMDINKSIKLVKQFLNGIDKKYAQQFEKALVDGTFDIFLPEDDLIDRPGDPITSPKPNAGINIPVRNTIEDGAIIVHEFFHFLNDTNDFIITREIFTEFISIYFENRYYNFLEEKGYEKTCFYNEVYERIDSTFDSANNLAVSASILDIYHNTGDISEENIDFLDKYRKIYKEMKEEFIELSNTDEFTESIECFNEDVSYVIGTLLTYYLLSKEENYDDKVKYINENINSLNLLKILPILNTNFSDYKDWLKCSIKYLEEALGEIYEKDNCNSRTYWSR